jgi:hypothetical protein
MAKKKPQLLSDEAYAALILEATRPKADKEKKFINLGWKLMEAKFQYYKLDAPLLEDYQYDLLEREYDSLAKELGVVPTATDMVGFDQVRSSGVLVADKIQQRDPPKEPV